MDGVLNPVGATAAPTTFIPKKPKFPGAKTYKDKQGNIREVGTGKLIRAVAKVTPAGKPVPTKTGNSYFTDGQGVVRKIGSGVAKNPLDAQVDAAILQQTAPLTTQMGQTNQQFAADQGVLNGSNTALQTQLGQLQQHIGDISSSQLGNAANAAGGTAANQTANLDYLKSILGSNMLDGGASLAGSGAALAGQAQAEGASNAKGIQLGSLGQTADLAGIGAASALQTRSTIADRMRARDAGLTDLQSKIAAAKANRFGVKNDILDHSLDQSAARQQIKLAQAQYDDNKAQQATENTLAQGQLDLQTQSEKDQAAAATARANGAAASTVGKYTLAGLDKRYDAAADAALKQIQASDPAKVRFRNIVADLRKHGIPGGSAVILAAQWAPQRVKDPIIAYATLKNGSLGFKVSDAVAQKVFQAAGLDWTKRTAAKVAPAAKGSAGGGKWTNSHQNDGLFLAALTHNGVGDSFTIGSDQYTITAQTGKSYTVSGPGGRIIKVKVG